MMERLKAQGARSDACWKLIELSQSFSAPFEKDGPAARALAFAARALLLAGADQGHYWRLRSVDPLDVEAAASLCAREALREQPVFASPASHWHLFLSASLGPFAPDSARALGRELWERLSPSLQEGVALSCVEHMSRLSAAFAPLSARLKPKDQLEAAQLCAELCSLSPGLAARCKSEIALARRSGRVNRGWEPAAQWLESRLEGVEIESASSSEGARSQGGSARRL